MQGSWMAGTATTTFPFDELSDEVVLAIFSFCSLSTLHAFLLVRMSILLIGFWVVVRLVLFTFYPSQGVEAIQHIS